MKRTDISIDDLSNIIRVKYQTKLYLKDGLVYKTITAALKPHLNEKDRMLLKNYQHTIRYT